MTLQELFRHRHQRARGQKEGGKAKGKLETNSGKGKKPSGIQNMGRQAEIAAQDIGAWRKRDARGPILHQETSE